MKEAYLQEFANSKIDPEIISLNFQELGGEGIYEYLAVGCKKRKNDGRLPDAWLKLYQHCEAGGWWCSGLDLISLEPSLWGCFKPDNPRMDGYGLKAIKYEHPKGLPTSVFALQMGGEPLEKFNVRYGVILTPETFWRGVIENTSIPVIVTEGAKKVACLLSQGFAAIGLSGIWGGYRRELLGPDCFGIIPELAILKGRPIVFALDQDAKSETRKQVKSALKKYQEGFEQLGGQFYSLFWDEKDGKGVDDLIVNRGEDYFESILTRVLNPVPVDLSSPAQPPGEYGELPAWAGENLHDSFQEQARKDLWGEGHYAALDRDLYKYNGRFYEKISPAAEEKRILDWADRNPVYDQRAKKWVKSHLQSDHINKIWDWALKFFRVDGEAINPPGLNLANGRLVLKWKGNAVKVVLEEHSPKVIYTYCSAVEYKKDANPEDCDKLLACLDEAQQKIFLRSLALALDLQKFRGLPKVGRVRACLLEGTGSNGKDALRTAVSQIFVRGLVSTTFNDFANYERGSKGTLLKLEGACLSWSSENSTVPKIETLDSLKAAITGDPISVKALYVDEKEITPQSIFFFNINGVPRMDGALTAIITRWAIIRFTKTFALNPNNAAGEIQGDPKFKDNPNWVAKMVCPALLNRILAEIPNLLEEGLPYNLLDDSFREVREESCHLWEFVKAARIVEDKDGQIGISELWAALESWYEQNGTKEITTDEKGKVKVYWHDQSNKYDRNVTGKNQVYKAFQRLFPKIQRGRITDGDENKGRLFISGISFLPNSDHFASLPSPEPVSASPSASLCFTENKKADQPSEADFQNSVKLNPAPNKEVKQNTQKSEETTLPPAHTEEKNFSNGNGHTNGNGKLPPIDPDRESALADILFWRNGLGWDAAQLKAYVREHFGELDAMTAPLPDLLKLKQALSKEMPYITSQEVF